MASRRRLPPLLQFFLRPPTFLRAWGVLLVPSLFLFTRHLLTEFVLDEQRGLRLNPYLRDPSIPWTEAWSRDFWGRTASETIGAYRPLPSLVWRALNAVGDLEYSPFFHHLLNPFVHAANGALLAVLVYAALHRARVAWLAGALFVTCAVSTEAVCAVVGLADLLAALGALLAVGALAFPKGRMALAVFGATLMGLFSKESAAAIVIAAPMVAFVMWRDARRALVAFGAAAAAFVASVEVRRTFFPAAPMAGHPPALIAPLVRWYAQPAFELDAVSNPLAKVAAPLRVSGALHVMLRGLGQLLVPWPLSVDYSLAQETAPDHVVSLESALGAVILVAAIAAGIALALRARSAKERVIAIALLWAVLFYLPVSNLIVPLPTVRAERLWYAPALATSVLLALAAAWAFERRRALAGAIVIAFVALHAICARLHANDFRSNVSLWAATLRAAPHSAKAQLSEGTLLGAVSLDARLGPTRQAVETAPDWAMANVYLGDTLCLMNRVPEAWPYYAHGFDVGPNDRDYVALGLQCLWDHGALGARSPLWPELAAIARKHPGAWVDTLARDLAAHGAAQGGVDPRYRPAGMQTAGAPAETIKE